MKAQEVIKNFVDYLEGMEISKNEVTCEEVDNYLMSLIYELMYEMQDANVEETINEIEKIIKDYILVK